MVMCDVCGLPARKTCIPTRVNTDMKRNVRYSSSMGVDPSQIRNAMKAWPGSTYTPDGRLIIHSRAEKKKRMKQRGYIEIQ